MNYAKASSVLMIGDGSSHRVSEPDCSPHPLDIMAIFALYQSVD